MEAEKKMTVQKAVGEAYHLFMKDEFNLLRLIFWTRFIIKRPQLTDGTITRELRQLRSDGLIDYEVIDNHRAIYKKIKKDEQLKMKI